MENPLLRRIARPKQPETNRYEVFDLRNNPFPLDPGLSPSSDDPRVNGSIYNDELFIDQQNRLDQLLIPGNNGECSIAFLMDHATRRGKGIGKSAFLKHQRDRITADFGWQASKGKALLFAVHVAPPPACRKFWEFCRVITETMIEQDILIMALWRLRALSAVIPEEVLKDIGQASEWPKTIGNDSWLQKKGVDVFFTLHRTIRDKLMAAGVRMELADILSRAQNSVTLGSQLFSTLSDSRWRRDGSRIVFDDFVRLFEAAEFTRGLLLIDEVEKIVYHQNIGERRLFVESLRYCLFDADFANSKNKFYGILLTIHPGIQEILLSHWNAAGLDRFAPLAEPNAQETTIYFPPLDKKMAIPLVKVYLDYFRISQSKKGTIAPFKEDALIEALIKSGGVPGPMLRLLHRVIDHAIELGQSTISRSVVDKLYSISDRMEPREAIEEEILPPTKVDLTKKE
jgi:hypothetical protein